MHSGTWTIVIQAADLDFTVQRQFSLTVGASNTVVVTVSCSLAFARYVHIADIL